MSSQSYESFPPESAAARWGLFGFWVSLVLLLLVAAIQITAHVVDPRREILGGPLDNLTAAGLAAAMTGSLVVRVGAQVRRKQREILSALHQQRGAIEALARRIEALEAAGVPQNGKVIELGTRIASKIVHD